MLHLDHAKQEPEATLASIGLRRVEHVRVVVGQGRPVAWVTGVAHRYPRQFRVSMATAVRLAGVGVPVRIDHRADPDRAGR